MNIVNRMTYDSNVTNAIYHSATLLIAPNRLNWQEPSAKRKTLDYVLAYKTKGYLKSVYP